MEFCELPNRYLLGVLLPFEGCHTMQYPGYKVSSSQMTRTTIILKDMYSTILWLLITNVSIKDWFMLVLHFSCKTILLFLNCNCQWRRSKLELPSHNLLIENWVEDKNSIYRCNARRPFTFRYFIRVMCMYYLMKEVYVCYNS